MYLDFVIPLRRGRRYATLGLYYHILAMTRPLVEQRPQCHADLHFGATVRLRGLNVIDAAFHGVTEYAYQVVLTLTVDLLRRRYRLGIPCLLESHASEGYYRHVYASPAVSYCRDLRGRGGRMRRSGEQHGEVGALRRESSQTSAGVHRARFEDTFHLLVGPYIHHGAFPPFHPLDGRLAVT